MKAFNLCLLAVCSLFLISPARSTQSQFSRADRDLANYDRTVAEMNSKFAEIPADPYEVSWVQLKLQHMYDVDQYMRQTWTVPYEHGYTAEEKKYFDRQFLIRNNQIDSADTADLKELLKIYDWFRVSVFGKTADSQAWIIVQHADLDPEFQKKILKILVRLYPIGETSKTNYAYLVDRVAASWNDPSKRTLQRYGTQVSCDGGHATPIPMEDPEHVDERRAAMGMKPLSEYLADVEQMCQKR